MKSRMDYSGSVIATEFSMVVKKNGVGAVLMAQPSWLAQDHRFVILERPEYVDISFVFWCEIFCRNESDAGYLLKADAGFRKMDSKDRGNTRLYHEGGTDYVYQCIAKIISKMDQNRRIVDSAVKKLTDKEKEALKSVGVT